jgi:AcrR family transcriptional regulator
MPKLGMEAIRRRQVVDAVIKILEQQGWKDLTIREVSDVAGVSAGIVTHYFGNKRTMTMDAVAEAHHRFARALHEIERRRLAPQARLMAAAELDLSADPSLPGPAFWLALWGRMPFDRLIKAEMNRLRQRRMEVLCDIIGQGTAQGVFKTARDAEAIARGYLTLLGGLTLDRVLDAGDAADGRARDVLLDYLARELGFAFDGPNLVRGAAAPAPRSRRSA